MRIQFLLCFVTVIFCSCVSWAQQEDPLTVARPLAEFPELLRSEDHRISRSQVKPADLPIKVPRFAAPLRKAGWIGEHGEIALDLTPEIDHWILTWPKTTIQPNETGRVLLQFDAKPLLLNEVKPLRPAADGSLFLPAHLATTRGDKLRYEPQPFKNTVGYWTNVSDSANWQVEIDRPGKFNLAILQGCGTGQGGSLAKIEVIDQADKLLSESEFEVLETGHFQNFQWIQRPMPIEIKVPGIYSIRAVGVKISKNAMMDIRAVHLIRLP